MPIAFDVLTEEALSLPLDARRLLAERLLASLVAADTSAPRAHELAAAAESDPGFVTLSDGSVVNRSRTRRLADLAGSLTRPGQPKVAIENMTPFASASSPIAARRTRGAKATKAGKAAKRGPI